MYVLDTNTVIYAFTGKGEVASRLLSVKPAEVAIPAVSVYELEVGIELSRAGQRRRDQLDSLLSTVNVLSFGRTEARAAAQIRRGLERTGRGIGPLDVLIAATAQACAGILVTHNVRELSRVPGLLVEDWY